MPIYKVSNTKNKEGKLQYRVRVNYTDSFGNHKQLTRLVWGSTEAKELERKLTAQASDKELSSSITIDQLFNEYTETLKFDIRETSMVKKKTIYTSHIASMGNIRINKLTVHQLTKWKNEINLKTTAGGKPLSLRTKQNAYREFHALLNYAVKMEYLPFNPIKKIDNFRDAYQNKKEIAFYTADEFKQYIAAALEVAQQRNYYDFYVFFNIAYFTGCRKGEIHALRWSDIKGNTLSVTKSLSQKLKSGDAETPPKNSSSNRTIQLPSHLMAILKEHKKRQQQYCASVNQTWSDALFICGMSAPLRDTSLENENIKYAKLANLHHIRIHDFRHSHASLLVNNNINILEVSRRLGHSNIEMTLNTYSHFFPQEEEKALQILNNF